MICDRVGVIDHGKWITTASLEDLRSKSTDNGLAIETNDPHAALQCLSAEHPSLQIKFGEGKIIEIADYAGNLNPLLESLFRKEIQVLNVERKKQTLEDVFLQMTGGTTA